MNKPKGFTLIELLVVISIIAVLVSLILPSLGQARDTAKRTLCQSKLHSVAIGAMAYAQDNKQSLPYRDSWGGGIETTTAVTPDNHYDGIGKTFEQGYITDYRAFYCPAVDDMTTFIGGYHPRPEDYKPYWVKPLWFPGYIFITYQYRPTSYAGWRPFKLTDPRATNQAFFGDYWLYNNRSKAHKMGYQFTRLDGSVQYVGDEKGLLSFLAIQTWWAQNTDWTFQETNWQNFFD